jgi:endonuclease/exonuclease/phosphatase family metal-dependent hydrolase
MFEFKMDELKAHRIYLYFLLLPCISLILCGCTDFEQPSMRITIGTFNMEWFGDNSADDRKPRTEADDRLLAEVLRDTGADILAVQEIENTQAMERLLRVLPRYGMKEYRFVLGASGNKQHVGFLFRPPVQVDRVCEVESIAVEKGRTRAGLLAECSVSGCSWQMLAVHLKSTSHADSTPALEERSGSLRQAQAAQIRTWADSTHNALQQQNQEANIIILGDCNDSPRKKRSALDTLRSAPYLTFLTEDLQSCSYSGLPTIDHILVSDALRQRVLRGTLRTVNFRVMLPDNVMGRVSDHCPVVVQISTEKR